MGTCRHVNGSMLHSVLLSSGVVKEGLPDIPLAQFCIDAASHYNALLAVKACHLHVHAAGVSFAARPYLTARHALIDKPRDGFGTMAPQQIHTETCIKAYPSSAGSCGQEKGSQSCCLLPAVVLQSLSAYDSWIAVAEC